MRSWNTPLFLDLRLGIKYLIKKLDSQEYKGDYDVKTFIIHDCVNLALIESIVRVKIPPLRKIIKSLFESSNEIYIEQQ